MFEDSVLEEIKELLVAFSPTTLNEIISLCSLEVLSEGNILFKIGEKSDALYFVLSGRMAVKQKTGFEERMQVVGLLDKGAVVGEGSLAMQPSRSTTVVAASPESKVVKIELSKLLKMIQEKPEAGVELYRICLQSCSLRLRENTKRMAYIL